MYPFSRISDPFRSDQQAAKELGENVCGIDTSSFAILVSHAISENLAQGYSERSRYDQLFLEAVASYSLKNNHLLDSSLEAILLAERILIPNIDIFAGELMTEGVVEYASTGSYITLKSEDCRAFCHSLIPYVENHPLALDLKLSRMEIIHSIDCFLGFIERPDDVEKARKFVVVTTLLQELRSVISLSQECGFPLVSRCLAFPYQKEIDRDVSAIGMEIYFENAVYSPRPRNIREALDLRNNPKIEQWRSKMRSWAKALTAGEITEKEVVGEIESANGLIKTAKFGKELVPSWSIYCTMPISVVSILAGGPIGAVLGGSLFALDAASMFGRIVWDGVDSGKIPNSGWYIINERSRTNF